MSQQDTQHASHDAHGHGEHANHGGIAKYLLVFVALCFLTGASFFTYSSYWPFDHNTASGRHITWAFMMAVSCTKAMLVVMFFMHLLWEANWKWVLTVPASFMSIFLLLMLVPDVGMRTDNGFAWYSPERLLYAADVPADSALAHDPQIEREENEPSSGGHH